MPQKNEQVAWFAKLYWGEVLLDVQALNQGDSLSVGTDVNARFHISSNALEEKLVELIRWQGERLQMREQEGERLTLSFKSFDKMQWHFDALRVELEQQKKSVMPFVQKWVDFSAIKMASAVMLAHVSLMIALLITPSFSKQADDVQMRAYTEVMHPTTEHKKTKVAVKKVIQKESIAKVQKRVARSTTKRSTRSGARSQNARALADQALAALGFGQNNLAGALGNSMKSALEGLKGNAKGVSGASMGMGNRLGGGGGGDSLYSMGSINGEGGDGFGDGDRFGDGGRQKTSVRVTGTRSKIIGGLSKEEIARVLRRANRRLRFCYERTLQRDPNAQGKVSVQFKIAASGRVATSKLVQDTFRQKAVGQCVSGVIKTLKFPKPKGGGVVFVTHPWIFSQR